MTAFLRDDRRRLRLLSPDEQRFARMLFYSLWSDGGGFASYGDGLQALGSEAATRSEIAEVVDIAYSAQPARSDRPRRASRRHPAEDPSQATSARRSWQRSTSRRSRTFREGVWYSAARNIDAFFVTLTKSEADYSPTTMYADYPISPTLFHWESQSTTSVASKTGQRYLSGSSTVLIFVRQRQTDEFGTSPYLFLGPATYVTHEGDRPIAITWKLEYPMPADFFNAAAAIAQ